jgi:hypothetical protein
MKQLSSKKAVSAIELALVGFLAICAVLAVVQGLGMLGASLAATEHAAPIR